MAHLQILMGDHHDIILTTTKQPASGNLEGTVEGKSSSEMSAGLTDGCV